MSKRISTVYGNSLHYKSNICQAHILQAILSAIIRTSERFQTSLLALGITFKWRQYSYPFIIYSELSAPKSWANTSTSELSGHFQQFTVKP